MVLWHTNRRSRLSAGTAAALAFAGSLMLPAAAAAADESGAKTVDARGNVRAASAASGARAAARADSGMVGKLERELADLLASPRAAAAGDAINVIYVMKATPGATGRSAGMGALRARVAAANEGVAARLRQAGHRIIYRARYANVIVAAAPVAGIRAMRADDDVEGIYLERVNQARLNVSNVVTQANIVYNLGTRGSGVRVGVVEPNRIASHVNLPASRRILCRPGSSSLINGHKTNVAGVIQSTNGTNRGMAPLITLVDGIGANFSDAEMMAATDCVIGQGAVAINMSFGVDTDGFFDGFARYVDATAHNSGRTIVVAVTNSCSLRIGSPEIAFNALAVGSYSDRNTTAGGDDRHSCNTAVPAAERHSGFRDPVSPHSDREEPDLLGPGHRIRTTNTSNGFSDATGTSFAAPHLTGIAGLVRNRAGSSIQNQNERLRAILMASARKNIEGASRLSELDGTGSVQAAAANRVVANAQSYFFRADRRRSQRIPDRPDVHRLRRATDARGHGVVAQALRQRFDRAHDRSRPGRAETGRHARRLLCELRQHLRDRRVHGPGEWDLHGSHQQLPLERRHRVHRSCRQPHEQLTIGVRSQCGSLGHVPLGRAGSSAPPSSSSRPSQWSRP